MVEANEASTEDLVPSLIQPPLAHLIANILRVNIDLCKNYPETAFFHQELLNQKYRSLVLFINVLHNYPCSLQYIYINWSIQIPIIRLIAFRNLIKCFKFSKSSCDIPPWNHGSTFIKIDFEKNEDQSSPFFYQSSKQS